jgi:hypothetical protein
LLWVALLCYELLCFALLCFALLCFVLSGARPKVINLMKHETEARSSMSHRRMIDDASIQQEPPSWWWCCCCCRIHFPRIGILRENQHLARDGPSTESDEKQNQQKESKRSSLLSREV